MDESIDSGPPAGRVCPNDHPVGQTDDFCPRCGASLVSKKAPDGEAIGTPDGGVVAPVPRPDRKWVYLAVGSVVGLVALVAIIVIVHSSGTSSKSATAQSVTPASTASPAQECVTNT